MSKLFYDHLLDFSEIEKEIKKITKSAEEREELFKLVDEIIHHRVLGCILDKMPEGKHEEFIEHLTNHPHHEKMIDYLKENIPGDVEDFIRKEIYALSGELLKMIHEETKPGKS